jgi:hypothetical protein
MLRYALILFFFLVVAGNSHALPIRLDFTAAGFDNDLVSPFSPAPQDPVSGTFIWEADSINDPIQELTWVDLTIAGHTYTLGELDFFSPTGQGTDVIGAGYYRSIGAGTDDFLLQWYNDPLETVRFVYSSIQFAEGIWETNTFSKFTFTVPVVSTAWLLGLGLVVSITLRKYLKRTDLNVPKYSGSE